MNEKTIDLAIEVEELTVEQEDYSEVNGCCC
jgi:hypothetical protein